MRWLAAILVLVALPASATLPRYPDVEGDKVGTLAYPDGRLDCPGRGGHYGFGSCATGGTGLTTFTVDTTTWVGPSDGGFDRSDCDAAGGDACSLAEAVCRAAQAGGGIVAVNVAGAIRIPNTVSANDGTGSSAFTLRDCPGVTASTPARNITITGAGATGAGAYITNGDFFIDAAYNVVFEQMRHRGSADDGTDHSYLGAGFGVLSGDLIVGDHLSVAGTQAYASAVNTAFIGNGDAPLNRVSYSNGLLGPTHMFNRARRDMGTNEFVNAGTCSVTTSQQCCVDATVTTGVGGCPVTETCVGADADSCGVMHVAGLCFGGLDGGADLATGGAACDEDSDCRGGVCAAYCGGTGASAGKRAGTLIGNGHESSTAWVFSRNLNTNNPPTHGVCYAGTRVGLPCTNDGHCTGGGAGSCVMECPNATDFAVDPNEGLHNYGLFTGGNWGHVTVNDHLVMGNKWRSPEVSPDAFSSGTLTLNRATQAEFVRIEAYGGLYQTNIWTEDTDTWNRYRHDLLFYRNHHNLNTANRALFADIFGNLVHANWEIASFNTTQDAAANARYYFTDNLDRFHGVGTGTCSATTTTVCCVDGDCPGVETCVGESASCEMCEDGVGLACEPTHTNCDSFSTNFGDAGADCTYETGATVSDSKYSGPRDPFTKLPASAATHAAEHTAKLAALGATLPCRDAVDAMLVREVTADRAIRIASDRLEIGGPQVDMTSCVDAVVNVAPTCGTTDLHFASGSGWVAWSQTVTNTDTWPLTMFCAVSDPGTVSASVYQPAGCADGTVEGAANLTGQPDGSYPITYYADDGEDRVPCTFNLIMP